VFPLRYGLDLYILFRRNEQLLGSKETLASYRVGYLVSYRVNVNCILVRDESFDLNKTESHKNVTFFFVLTF
jgi:hypothetical protein